MDNINSLRLRLAIMLADRRPQKPTGKLYLQERAEGKTYDEIGRKHGISRQAVYNACWRYRKIMEKEGNEDG